MSTLVLGLLAAAAALWLAPAQAATLTADTIVQLYPNASANDAPVCDGPVRFRVPLTLGAFASASATISWVALGNGSCTCASPCSATMASNASTINVDCTMSNGIYDDGFSFTATGSIHSEVATANITGATEIFPNIVRAVFPTVTLGTIVQSPSPLSVANFGATLDTQNVTFTIPVMFADLGTSPQSATVPTITPALSGCNASDADFANLTADYTASVTYTCFYANRSQIPAVPITFTTYSNTTAFSSTCNTTISTGAALKAVVDLTSSISGAQQCNAGDLSRPATYKVTLVVAGARNGIIVPTNCTLVSSTWVKAADKIGTLVYTCTAYNNATTSFPFIVMGDVSNITSTYNATVPVAAVQPAVSIDSVTQGLLLPVSKATNVQYQATVTYTSVPAQNKIFMPSLCNVTENTTALTYPFTGALHFTCAYPVNLVTQNAYIDSAYFTFEAQTAASGCSAKAYRNLSVVYEPEVGVSLGSITQGCASSNGAVTYKVPVTYRGSKKAPAVLPSSCVQISAGGLNANGDGSITYQCSFANATTANQTAVNITANGLISSEMNNTWQMIPTAVVATAPSATITVAPNQTTLLAYGDVASPINYTVSVAFEGAVGTGGVSRISQPARCSAVGNGTDALSGGSGTVNFVCAFNSTPDAVAASPLKFRANTAAADCYAEDAEALVVATEPIVAVWALENNQSCLTNLSNPVEYDLGILFNGAKVNYTYPSDLCKEVTKPVRDVNGTGVGVYSCSFKNSTSVVTPLTFSATGLLGVNRSANVDLTSAVKAAQPSVKLGDVSQDLLQDNSSQAIFTVTVEFGGADFYESPYNCSPPGYVAPFTGKEGLVNGSGKVTFVCAYANASSSPTWLTFTSRTAARGCFASASVNISAKVAAADSVVPYTYSMHFEGMSYAQLIADPAKTAKFKLDVRTRVSRAVDLPLGNVEVTNLTQGSVIAEVVLHTPATWSPEQVNTAANTLADPASLATVFDPTFLDTYDITSISVQVVSALPPVSKGLSDTAKIGIGVGAGVGGAALIGGIAGVAIARKRRMSVEPRDRLNV